MSTQNQVLSMKFEYHVPNSEAHSKWPWWCEEVSFLSTWLIFGNSFIFRNKRKWKFIKNKNTITINKAFPKKWPLFIIFLVNVLARTTNEDESLFSSWELLSKPTCFIVLVLVKVMLVFLSLPIFGFSISKRSRAP